MKILQEKEVQDNPLVSLPVKAIFNNNIDFKVGLDVVPGDPNGLPFPHLKLSNLNDQHDFTGILQKLFKEEGYVVTPQIQWKKQVRSKSNLIHFLPPL